MLVICCINFQLQLSSDLNNEYNVLWIRNWQMLLHVHLIDAVSALTRWQCFSAQNVCGHHPESVMSNQIIIRFRFHPSPIRNDRAGGYF